MNSKLQYTFIGLLVIAIIGLGWFGFNQKHKSEELNEKLETQHVPSKKVEKKSLQRDEVDKYQKIVESKIDALFKGEYNDDDLFTDGSAGNTIYRAFAPSGLSGVSEDSTKKDYIKRYKDIDYELNNVTAQKDENGEVTLVANAKITYKDSKVENDNILFAITIGNDDKLKGGTIYAKQ